VTPEVSQPTQAFGGVSVNGLNVPSFRTRRVATGVELGDGQSFAIGGLLQESVQSDLDRIPFLGEIPILGQLFSSQNFQRDETELVVIVTPKLVQPLGSDPLPLPGDSYVEPSRLDLAMGRIEGDPRPDRIDPNDPRLRNANDPEEESTLGGLIGPLGLRLEIPRPVGEGT